MSNSDTDDLKANASELDREAAEQLRLSEDERTCELVRASAEYVGSGRPYGQSSPSELKSLLQAVEQHLRQSRDKRKLEEDRLPGVDRRKH